MAKRCVRSLVLLVAFAAGVSGCGPLGTHRDNINAENDADAQAKTQELQKAAGTYSGQVTLAVSDQRFDVVIDLEVIPQNAHSANSVDPTVVAKIPVLGGSMHFPAMDNLGADDLSDFSGLTDPMGQCSRVNIDFGDYNASTNEILLPYTIPNYSTGSYGELSGTFTHGATQDRFTGQWTSKLGLAGTFDVSKAAVTQ